MGFSNLKLKIQGRDLVLPVLVRPGARRDEIVGVREGVLNVSISAPAVEGKANAACRRLLADILRLPVSRVEIIAGAHARRKRILLRNADAATLDAHLAPLLK